MVPENEFHHKEQPARNATPANQQNGPGSTGKPASSTSKTEEGTSEDNGVENTQHFIFYSSVSKSCADIFCVVCFAERVKHKSDSATKLMNKANSAAAKVTTSNGNGALNRYESFTFLSL